jgi:hypothetical protein
MSLWKQVWRAFSKESSLEYPPLYKEDEFLLCAARARTNPETVARMRSLLQEEVDWKGLITAARRHGLATLLYIRLHSACTGLVPKSVLLQLGRRFVLNCARNRVMTAELVRILALFESSGIPALSFKGPLLAESIYEDLALREFDDLDILVPESKVAEAESLLRTEGYLATSEVPQERSVSYRRMQHEIAYRHPRKSIFIDLHWKMAPVFFQFSMDMQRLWTRTEWTSLAGSRVRSLSKEDTLLILCAHGSRHFWEKLEWVGGVAGVISAHPGMNWGYVLELARDLRSERVLLLGLLMAANLFGAEIPDAAWQRIRKDEVLCTLAAEAQRRLFFPDFRPVNLLEECFNMASLTDRWQDGLRIFLRTLFLPRYNDWTWLKLPSCLFFLYYPVRIFRLLRKYAIPAV